MLSLIDLFVGSGGLVNFPEAQKTGRLGELDVERLFTSWSWTVGRDHIDTGYDLNVEPDIAEFRGHRFLVQVKATKQHSKAGNIVAPVEKSRLRQYARNPLPVFVVRSSAEGKLYWLHVQAWVKKYGKRLVGNGETGIKLPTDQLLDDKDKFVAYLRDVFKAKQEGKASLANIAMERSNYLSSIDPRLLVRVGLRHGVESYEIFANSEPATLKFDIEPSDQDKGKERLMDAIQYGLPADIEVDSFRMKGSALFKELGVDSALKGTLSIRPHSSQKGTVNLHPGETYSMLATSISFPARLYSGQSGIAVNNEGAEAVFEFKVRSELGGLTKVTLGFRNDLLWAAPIRELSELAIIGDWAHEVLQKNTMYFDLSFGAKRAAMIVRKQHVDQMRPILVYAFWLGRLHRVANALNSNLTMDKDFTLSEEDEADIHLAYWLLKGERREVTLGPIEISGPETVPVKEPSGDFYLETAIAMTVGGKPLGVIPVAADLNKYTFEALPGSGKYRISKNEGGNASMYYNDHGLLDAQMIRKK